MIPIFWHSFFCFTHFGKPNLLVWVICNESCRGFRFCGRVTVAASDGINFCSYGSSNNCKYELYSEVDMVHTPSTIRRSKQTQVHNPVIFASIEEDMKSLSGFLSTITISILSWKQLPNEPLLDFENFWQYKASSELAMYGTSLGPVRLGPRPI